MKKTIIFGLFIISVLILSGCGQTISKQEAEQIALRFLNTQTSDGSWSIINSYKEEKYWKVDSMPSYDDAILTVEVQANTGKIEFVSYNIGGELKRIPYEDIIRGSYEVT